MSLITTNAMEAVTNLVTRATDAREQIATASKGMRMFLISAARKQLMEMLTTDIVDMLMGLQGTPLGFKTDKDANGGYPREIVRQVAAQAFLSGLYMADNEVNIIGGNMYATKNGCRRLVEEFEGSQTFGGCLVSRS